MLRLAMRTFVVVGLIMVAGAENCPEGQCPATSKTGGGIFMQLQTKPKKALVEVQDGPHILQQCPATEAGQTFGNVQTSQVNECSGLAASRVNRGVYWVNNDSGDGPKLYGLTREGRHVARLRFDNSGANDWEDVAVGPGPEAGKSYIYVADVGDNRRQRGTVQIYRVEEPQIPEGRNRNDDIRLNAERFDVTYPDGMKYDCEAVFIDQGLGAQKHGTIGRFYLITKGDGRNNDPQWRGGDVFYVDLPSRSARLNFQKTGVRIPVEFATGADITPKGNVIAIRSYGNVLMWPRPCQWTVEKSMSRDACYVDKKNERQGEAIAFGKDGDHYITISEGDYQPVWWFGISHKFQQEMMSHVALLDIAGPELSKPPHPVEPRITNVCPATGQAQTFGNVQTRQVNECSGLAASRINAGVYWVNNDSGDSPRLYAISREGKHLARLKVRGQGVGARDWEDIAMGPGPEAGASYIYIADTGDNYRNRWSVQIYRVKEPSIPEGRWRNDDIDVWPVKFDIKYPNGKYDCEAMFVDQRGNGRVYIVTKGDNNNWDPQWRGGDLFYVDLPEQEASLTFQSTGVRIPVEWATGADMTPSGGIISIRSYGNVLMWPRADGESVEQSMAKDACYVSKQNERQGEAIAFGKDGDHYITVSEGRYPPVWYFDLSANFQQAMAMSVATE